MNFSNLVFNIKSEYDFKSVALAVFKYQYQNNYVYKEFCDLLKVVPEKVDEIEQIPFLPIEFFKTHRVACGNKPAEITFFSSGTTGQTQSKHFVSDISVYETSFIKSFELFYGNISEYCILALLPSYLERKGSSLVYMSDYLIKKSNNPKSGFYLNNYEELLATISQLKKEKQKTLLLGVSYALLDLAEKYNPDLSDITVMETGGMKGKRKELTKEELHSQLKQKCKLNTIHSEYGMTEFLSQAYSKGNGIFESPKWLRFLVRDINDPLVLVGNNTTGGINAIDLANYNSCSFIATQDLGKTYNNNTFEIIGRFDNSDVRGCNLLIQ
ncbi:MAG: acyl transferase [Flavobacteriales bacterium]|nr:acyl transferase [Flavobacteriales bacterium]